MQFIRIFLAGLALILVTIAVPASAQNEMTTKQLTALSPHSANRKAQQDLLSLFEPMKKFTTGMRKGVNGVDLTTHAHGTEFDGICSRDVITLWYAPVEKGQNNADSLLRPYRVEASPRFHILRRAHHEQSGTAYGGRIWDSACASVGDNGHTHWFAAKDARTVAQGFLALQATISAIKAGSLKAKSCLDFRDSNKTSCEAEILAHFDPADPEGIDTCPSEEGSVCYSIAGPNLLMLTIRVQVTENSLEPRQIISVDLEQQPIIVT